MSRPDFSFEKRYWRKGYRWVIGVDEVGRGAFAGPVIAAGAAMKLSNFPINQLSNVNKQLFKKMLKLGIDDSKKLSSQKRIKLAKEIKKYFYFGIGEASVTEINRLGIVKATERAMRRAIKELVSRIFNLQFSIYNQISISNFKLKKINNIFLLVDAFHVKYVPGVGLGNQIGIVHGDSRSISIAAASIIAKVYRDRLMERLSNKYTHYGWRSNKGYGTKDHRKHIKKFGVTKLHRSKFVENWMKV